MAMPSFSLEYSVLQEPKRPGIPCATCSGARVTPASIHINLHSNVIYVTNIYFCSLLFVLHVLVHAGSHLNMQVDIFLQYVSFLSITAGRDYTRDAAQVLDRNPATFSFGHLLALVPSPKKFQFFNVNTFCCNHFQGKSLLLYLRCGNAPHSLTLILKSAHTQLKSAESVWNSCLMALLTPRNPPQRNLLRRNVESSSSSTRLQQASQQHPRFVATLCPPFSPAENRPGQQSPCLHTPAKCWAPDLASRAGARQAAVPCCWERARREGFKMLKRR